MSRLRKVLDPTRTGKDAESLERTLLKLVVGQDEAVEQIVNIYQMHLTGLSAPKRPVWNFLSMGPTGSGKTRTVEATAEALGQNPRAVIKIDCAEFQHSQEIAKLIGSPPGYLGHTETHPLLSQEVIDQHHTDPARLSFILFDEMEKASDRLWTLLPGILDNATLTFGDNRKMDFSQAMIFMTGNMAANKMLRPGIEKARRKFTPEFMNRIDKVVVFKLLGKPELRRILDFELGPVQQRMLQPPDKKAFASTISAASQDFLLAAGADLNYRARHLKCALHRYLVRPFSNLVAIDPLACGD